MGWLGLKKRPAHEPEEVEEEPQPLPPLPPVLNLLVPDNAGVTSFRLKQFFAVEEAAEFIQTLPSISGLHAFWGLHEQPAADTNGEAMVLIRATEGSQTVYVVSFVDLASALSFARFEVKRGMNPNLLLIYWAEIVDVDADETGVHLSPDRPPFVHQARSQSNTYVEAPEAPPAPTAAEPEPQLFEADEPGARVPAAADLTETVVPPDQAWEREAEEEFEQFVAELEDEVIEAPLPEPEPVAIEEVGPIAGAEPERMAAEEPEPPASEEPEPVAVAETDIVMAERPEIAAQTGEPEARAVEVAEAAASQQPEPAVAAVESGVAEEEIDIEREALAFLKEASGAAPAEPEAAPREEAAPEPGAMEPPETAIEGAPEISEPERVDGPVAVSEADTEAPPEPAAGGAAPAQTPPSAPVEDEDASGEDLIREVEKILRVKRWDKRDSPFRGFDSPPGRF